MSSMSSSILTRSKKSFLCFLVPLPIVAFFFSKPSHSPSPLFTFTTPKLFFFFFRGSKKSKILHFRKLDKWLDKRQWWFPICNFIDLDRVCPLSYDEVPFFLKTTLDIVCPLTPPKVNVGYLRCESYSKTIFAFSKRLMFVVSPQRFSLYPQ